MASEAKIELSEQVGIGRRRDAGDDTRGRVCSPEFRRLLERVTTKHTHGVEGVK